MGGIDDKETAGQPAAGREKFKARNLLLEVARRIDDDDAGGLSDFRCVAMIDPMSWLLPYREPAAIMECSSCLDSGNVKGNLKVEEWPQRSAAEVCVKELPASAFELPGWR